MANYIEWDKLAQGFKTVQSNQTEPPDPSLQTWWTSTSNTVGTRAATQVTHLGNRESAEFRARSNAAFRACPTGLYELRFRESPDVLDAVYLENHGEEAMRAFEKKLLDSESDAAFYWNEKEANGGAWSLVLRRDRLGELPNQPQPHISIESKFSFVSVKSAANGLPYIEWVRQ